MDYDFNPQITLWKRKEPNLKCVLLRVATPIAGLIDALVAICSLTLLVSNFEMEIVILHSLEYFKAQKMRKLK